MKLMTKALISASLSAMMLSGCAVRVPGASVVVDPSDRLERRDDGRRYDGRGGRDYDDRDGRYHRHERDRDRRGFCPPGQAKKGRC
jgi:hypothetical protein